jgi:ribonucleoside-diphosphate reductase beta chain
MRLDPESLPLRDYHKAKRLMWNPQDIDYSKDATDFAAMTDAEKTLVRTALALFIGGEAAVTHDLSPLLIALKREGGRLEEEMFITTQLFEESKHVEFFAAVLEAIGNPEVDPDTHAGASYPQLFAELDRALEALLHDHSPKVQAEAVVTYHMIVEGVLAETGYYGFFRALREKNLMPGLTQGLEYLQRDEARHIAFGLHLLSRLIQADPGLWQVVQARLEALMPIASGVYMELLLPHMQPDLPFGLDLNDIMGYAGRQYTARVNVLERAHLRQTA